MAKGYRKMEQSESNETPTSFADVRNFFYLLWSLGWLITLAGLLAGVTAFLVSSRAIPIYETNARLLVSDPPAMRSIDYTSIVSSQSMTKTYAEMLVDRPVLEGVIDQLDLQILPENLKKTISVELIPGTQLLDVSVENADPILATAIANSLGSVFAERIRELQSQRYSATQAGLTQQVSAMEEQIATTTRDLELENDSTRKSQLEARLTEYRRLYSNLVTNYEQVRLAEAQTSVNVVVSQPAVVPNKPVRPDIIKNTLFASLAGMLLTIVTLTFIEVLDDTLKNPDKIRQEFNLPILGMIATHNVDDQKIITLSQPRSPVAEAFRSIRTNITFASVDKPLRRILVTSATPGDGKTTVVTNLAVTLAQGERKVVLIDSDLRRPQVNHRLGLSNQPGLSQLFVQKLDTIQEVIQENEVPGLAVITAGDVPPNPSELLMSNKMNQILDHLTQEYDLVLIDTPPVLSVTDAVALAPKMDGLIVVIKPGKTRKRDLRNALEQLRGVGARVLGLVLNGVDLDNRKYNYYYGEHYSQYSHYYEQDSVGEKHKKSGFQWKHDKSRGKKHLEKHT